MIALLARGILRTSKDIVRSTHSIPVNDISDVVHPKASALNQLRHTPAGNKYIIS